MMTTIVLPVLAGLALFLFGMRLMETALQHWAGARLQLWLERFTRTPVRGLATGTLLTAALQSSTAITVIAIGLVNAGVLTLPRTLGIILGTNIGTCLTTELIGLSIGGIGVPMLLASAGVWLASWFAGPLPPAAQGLGLDQTASASPGSRPWLRSVRYGSLAVAGFALVLLGIEIMQTIGPALQSRGLFAWFVLQAKTSLLWGVIAGAAVTALVHSSAAVIAMAMGLATIQGIPVELGVAITIGANIGTCVTALIAGMSGLRAGRYVAWSHILLNVGGAILFYPWIAQLVHVSAFMAGNASEQIARAQTIFNVISSLLALPLCYLSKWNRIDFRS
ncbi:Na/Pi cotransporter family protein [Paenibacillus sp. SI8]|uniref:Na/Pi cotransporter family protein n=1 Tax=unclassified Paenibacillus TaxID=185978 RepID=UPI00346604EC